MPIHDHNYKIYGWYLDVTTLVTRPSWFCECGKRVNEAINSDSRIPVDDFLDLAVIPDIEEEIHRAKQPVGFDINAYQASLIDQEEEVLYASLPTPEKKTPAPAPPSVVQKIGPFADSVWSKR